MKKTRLKKIILVFAAMLVLLSSTTVMASGLMPDLTRTTGTLTILFQSADVPAEAIDGAEIDVIQVAGVTVTNGAVHYDMLPEFVSSGVDPNAMNTENSIQAAKTLADLIEQSGQQGTRNTTDASGKASFDNLPVGMYLVRQTGSAGTALQYTNFAPFLVQVPQKDPMSDSWIYDVTAEPKPVKKHPTTTETTTTTTTTPTTPGETAPSETPTVPPTNPTTTPPESGKPEVPTGDSSHILFYAGCALITAALAAALLTKRRSED